MKTKAISILFVYLSLYSSLFAQDHIIFRDGREQDCKVIQVNSDKTLCKENDKKKAEEIILDNSDIYMIRYEKRGNVFFTEEGERFSGKTIEKPDSKATMVYLKEGKEIEAFDFEMTSDSIKYKDEKGRINIFTKREKEVETKEIPKSDIFMLKYPDGTKDILTPFVSKKKEKEQSRSEKKTKNQPDLASNVDDDTDMEYSETETNRNLTNQQGEEDNTPNPEDLHITLPCKATIETIQNATIAAIVQSDDGDDIAYKRQSNPNGPTYHIRHANIKNIQYEKQTVTETPKPSVTPIEKEEQSRSYPCKAVIKTKQGLTIRAIVQSDNGVTISYKKQTNPKGRTYYIKHSSIRNISY